MTLPWPSRIGVRLLAFNLLLLFLPIAGILYLDVYEARLLEAQERAMVQQGRLLAAALTAAGGIEPPAANALLARLSLRPDSRLRVYDARGGLVADTNRIRFAGEPTPAPTGAYSLPSLGVRAGILYRMGAWFVATRDAVAGLSKGVLMPRRNPVPPGPEPAAPLEVQAALSGRYQAATRPTPGQRSLTLNSALPVRQGDTVIGAVLVSQTTFRVLQALYRVRLRIFEVVLMSLVAAAFLTTLAAATVVRPIVRLRREASDLAERRSRLPGTFHDAGRHDEVGDLARALQELTRRLDEHIRAVEQFASDVSHEFKNPLAAIRTAAEMAMQAEDAGDRTRFLAMLTRDADRLERLVSDVRELARLDAQLEQEPVHAVDVVSVVTQVIAGLRLAQPSAPDVVLTVDAQVHVRASADRLAQAFENIVGNALSFAPSGTVVEVRVSEVGGLCKVLVADRGPGIPAGHLDRIFDRFFTYRPLEQGRRHEHAGLGLAIARTVIQGYGGTIAANNRAGGGACFEVSLPLVKR